MYGKNHNIPHPDAIATMFQYDSLPKPELTIDDIGRNVFFPQCVLGEGKLIQGLQASIHGAFYAIIAFK